MDDLQLTRGFLDKEKKKRICRQEEKEKEMLAGDVHFVIGQDEGVKLNRFDEIRIVAHDAGESSLADLFQLRRREGGRLIAQFVPETVAHSDVVELRRDDAGERRTQKAPRQGTLRHAARPQVDVVRRSAPKFFLHFLFFTFFFI